MALTNETDFKRSTTVARHTNSYDGASEIFAAKTATTVDFFKVQFPLSAGCAASNSCATYLGTIALYEPGAGPFIPLDWAVVMENESPALYTVTGDSSFLTGNIDSGLSRVSLPFGEFGQIESAINSSKVYLFDDDHTLMAMLQDGVLAWTDTSQEGTGLIGRPSMRLHPDGRYGYVPGAIQDLDGYAYAISFGALTP